MARKSLCVNFVFNYIDTFTCGLQMWMSVGTPSVCVTEGVLIMLEATGVHVRMDIYHQMDTLAKDVSNVIIPPLCH